MWHQQNKAKLLNNAFLNNLNNKQINLNYQHNLNLKNTFQSIQITTNKKRKSYHVGGNLIMLGGKRNCTELV